VLTPVTLSIKVPPDRRRAQWPEGSVTDKQRIAITSEKSRSEFSLAWQSETNERSPNGRWRSTIQRQTDHGAD
jgi:hypothetical protein